MKDRFLIVTSETKRTVYAPLSRLMRIEVSPEREHVSVMIVFEGLRVTVQTNPGAEDKFAQDFFERLVDPEMIDVVYLRREPGVTVNFEPGQSLPR